MDTDATSNPVARAASTSRRSWVLVALVGALVVSAYVAMTIYASPAFRGSDQYWYVEDVTTLANGGQAATHEVYPFSLGTAGEGLQEPRPFVHNVPVLWVWAAAARVLGDPHRGILAINIVCGLMTALLTYLSTRTIASRGFAWAASAFVLFVPVSFWVTSQDMSEPFSGTLIALAVWLVLRYPGRMLPSLVAAAVVALSAAGRIWAIAFLPLIALAPLALDEVRSKPRRWGQGALIGIFGLACYVPLSRVFVNYMPALGPMAILEISRATNNMAFYFALGSPTPFDVTTFLKGLALNARSALATQFSLTDRVFSITTTLPAIDRFPVNVAAIAALSGLFAPAADRRHRYAMLLGVTAFLMHVGMAVLYQNQPRYIVVAMAPLALGAAAALDMLWARAPRTWQRLALIAGVALVLVASVTADAMNARVYRTDALDHARARVESTALVEGVIPEDARVLLDASYNSHWPIDFALYPRPVLLLATDFPYDAETYGELAEKFGAQYLVADRTSTLNRVLGGTLLATNDRFSIYRLDPIP